jgi:Ca2+/Na+ antiporter
LKKFFTVFAWLEVVLGLTMLWMTWDVGLRASGQIFGALVVLIGIVLLYGLIIYALIGWFMDHTHRYRYVLTLVLTLLYNVLAWTFPSVMIQTWATYPFPLITLLIGAMLVWVARQEKQ